MSSYPAPPDLLPPAYLPLPHGQLGPSNPYRYPNFRNFERGLGQFHTSRITAANRATQFGPPQKMLKPSPNPGEMYWPQAQFKPQKMVNTYAGAERALGDCGCGGKPYGAETYTSAQGPFWKFLTRNAAPGSTANAPTPPRGTTVESPAEAESSSNVKIAVGVAAVAVVAIAAFAVMKSRAKS
jgi:hypothetical protein